MYIASDSRLTWGGVGVWDNGRKLFVARRYPHIFGFCGDVIFPTHTLSQIVDMIDQGFFADINEDVESCLERIISILSQALDTYPSAVKRAFQIVYGTREGDGMSSRFHVRLITSDGGPQLRSEAIGLPEKSGKVIILGSGKGGIKKHLGRWEGSEVKGTSRAVFSAFSDCLKDGTDQASGGPPQLVGLYRIDGGREFGVVWNGRRYFYGTEVLSHTSMETVKWHNDLFEICDPRTLKRKAGAQPQPAPRSLGKKPP